MNDNLIPLPTETQPLVNALHRVDIPIGSPGSKNAKSIGAVVAQRLSRHSGPQINQD
jgi:hypothetical protein